MKKNTFIYSIYVLGGIVALFVFSSRIIDALELTEPVITLHCCVDNYQDVNFSSFEKCSSNLSSFKDKYGVICSCGRSDSIYKPFNLVLNWLFNALGLNKIS